MEKAIIASTRKSAGKTSVVLGMSKAMKKKVGYMKPFGDRLIYRKKRLWDYDTALMTNVFALEDSPEDMCFGFDHAKLRYMYSDEGIKEKLLEASSEVGKGKEMLFIEAGKDLMYGTYVHLGALSLAKHTGSKLIVVVSGTNDDIIDDVAFLKKYLDRSEINFGGVIINKVGAMDEFKKTYLPKIEGLGVEVIGAMPHQEELTHFSLNYLSERLFAKVITGEGNLDRIVKSILIGAMTVDVPLQKILSQNKNALMITSGDRSDMILAALERGVEAIVLTNNILPPSNIISKAEDMGVPMLLVPYDTFQVVKQIDDIEPLITASDKDKMDLLAKLAKKNLDLNKVFGK